jgi:hypothetical protein
MGAVKEAATRWTKRHFNTGWWTPLLISAFRAGAKWRSKRPNQPQWGDLNTAAKERFRTKVNQQPHDRQTIIESNDLAQIMVATIGTDEGYLPWDVRYGLAEAVQANGYHRAAIPIDPTHIKMLREKLCTAQWAVQHFDGDAGVYSQSNVHTAESVSAALQGLIDGLDALRPLGPDGKHGTLHTVTCGCDGVNG